MNLNQTILPFTLIILGACSAPEQIMPEAEPMPENVLLAPWSGPYSGVPAFGRMSLEDLDRALSSAVEISLAEYQAIADNPAAANFSNTIAAYEEAGRNLSRVFVYYGIWNSNLSSPEFREIKKGLTPKIAAYNTKIVQNEALFRRIEAVRNSTELKTRSAAERRLVEQISQGFARNGATLGAEDKQRYASINVRLAELYSTYSNNVLADEEGVVHFLNDDQLAGLSRSYTEGAARAAASRGQAGKYAITNTRSSVAPFLTQSEERDLREEIWHAFYHRADNGDANDNNAVIAEILALRDERVELLGYENFAEWQLSARMAGEPDRALDLMENVWSAATARVREEVADMQAIADSEDAGITIEPWDYRFYAEKVRKDRYDLDSNEVKQYLQLDKLRDAMFFVAGELFGFAFEPVPAGSVPVFHPDVSVWEVTRKVDGSHVGLWYLDPFARPGKRSGAWAITYRGHETFNGQRTVLASNNSNFIKSDPVLISWTDAETFFHEFGHALHYLSSVVDYPSQNIGLRDYTEFQSQLLERWLITDEVINNFLVHHESGEPMPTELVAKIKAAATFNQGFQTTEYLASALVDMRYHMVDPTDIDPREFERNVLQELGMPSELVMRHRSTHFTHIFASESYAAGYYGYLWADVLTADAAEAFAESPGGFFDSNTAERMVKYLFSIRNMQDPAEAYREFRGRDAGIEPLMRDRGFMDP